MGQVRTQAMTLEVMTLSYDYHIWCHILGGNSLSQAMITAMTLSDDSLFLMLCDVNQSPV